MNFHIFKMDHENISGLYWKQEIRLIYFSNLDILNYLCTKCLQGLSLIGILHPILCKKT